MRRVRRRAGRLQTLLSLSVLAAAIAGGVLAGGHGRAAADAIGAATGFGLEIIRVSGQKETSDSAILAALGVYEDTTLLGLDAEAARARLESLPWIEEARVRLVLPGALDVEIRESEAFARWSSGGRTRVIDRSGRILADEAGPRFAHLPLLAGEGARGRAVEAVALLEGFDAIAEGTVAVVRVNDRRWDLMLETGITVKLPAGSPRDALARLDALDERHGLLARAISVVDLRLGDRTTVRLAPDALGPDGALPERGAILEARI